MQPLAFLAGHCRAGAMVAAGEDGYEVLREYETGFRKVAGE